MLCHTLSTINAHSSNTAPHRLTPRKLSGLSVPFKLIMLPFVSVIFSSPSCVFSIQCFGIKSFAKRPCNILRHSVTRCCIVIIPYLLRCCPQQLHNRQHRLPKSPPRQQNPKTLPITEHHSLRVPQTQPVLNCLDGHGRSAPYQYLSCLLTSSHITQTSHHTHGAAITAIAGHTPIALII